MAELREILEGLCEKTCDKENYSDKMLDQAITAIKSLFKSKLPKKITIQKVKPKLCPYSNKIKCCTMQDYTRNQALTEIKKRWEEI